MDAFLSVFRSVFFCFFFFNDTATTEIYTLSLHDALPIYWFPAIFVNPFDLNRITWIQSGDRKSTRLNSSHLVISYAVFCLKKTSNRHGQAWGFSVGPDCADDVFHEALARTVAAAGKLGPLISAFF